MSDNLKLSDELKMKLIKAESVEQVAEIVKADGQEITAEDAEHLWQEIAQHNKDGTLSVDELEAVSGGADRDWLINGCAATVEAGSSCSSNDKCVWWDVTYEHAPSSNTCPSCGGKMYLSGGSTETCVTCGYILKQSSGNNESMWNLHH